ncbi:Sulfatase family protein [Roseomonas mucosa]|uniref:sulfatase family protein n=1 Tax=Roseomonas mucosa TaxID=207340 RepID=UPI002203B33F|nr:sulfatase-like hydrolase/transferase [Roseomonas mucosa]QDJ08551.1 Sulfatase family protein [Roseomonas mucosa]
MATEMSRRGLLSASAMGATTLGAGLGAALAPPGAQAQTQGRAPNQATRQPNIIFIMADDLGVADVSCYGQRAFRTPAVDSLAGQGLRFLQAYASSAVCSATRTALITGRYQYRLPLGLWEPLSRTNEVGLPPEHPTLPSLLKRAGYSTALVGKWHLGALPKFGPLKSGYDRFWGFRGGTIDYYTHRGTDGKPDLWDGDLAIDQHGYATELLGRKAVEVVRDFAQAGRPFFLSLHFNAPHWPWVGPGDEAESERLKGKDLRNFDGGTLKTYGRMVVSMDEQIGLVLAELEERGIARDTIVIFTSDNGGERFSDVWPFNGRKTELLEGGLRIPAVIRWPARIRPGGTSEQVMASMDWLPTLLAAAGGQADVAYPPDGMDLLPALDGAAPVPRRLYWRYKANAQRAMRDGDLKYLKIGENSFLFNVVEDPMERANLKARQPAVFERMEQDWLAWNETMLPEIEESFTEAYSASQLADHFGARPPSGKPDLPPPPKR